MCLTLGLFNYRLSSHFLPGLVYDHASNDTPKMVVIKNINPSVSMIYKLASHFLPDLVNVQAYIPPTMIIPAANMTISASMLF